MTSPDYKKRMRQSSERLRKNPAARHKREGLAGPKRQLEEDYAWSSLLLVYL